MLQETASAVADSVIPTTSEARQDFLAIALSVAPDLALLPFLLECRKLWWYTVSDARTKVSNNSKRTVCAAITKTWLTSHGRNSVPALFELILNIPFPLEDGRVDCAEREIVLRSGKVQQAETIDVALIWRRQRDTVNGRLDVVASEEAERVASVDSEAPIERLGPLPLARLVVLDLECRDGLAEEKSDGAQIRVAGRPETIGKLLLLVLAEFGVLHVA